MTTRSTWLKTKDIFYKKKKRSELLLHNDVTDIFARKLSHVPNIIHSALQNLKLTNAF